MIGDYTRGINEAFADTHGHSFSWFSEVLDKDRPPSWSKILLAKKHLDDCDWFMWIDADACFVRPTKLEEFTSDEHFLVAQEDWNGLNAGVFLLKNCEQSHDFLTEVYLPKHNTASSRHRRWWEQEAIHTVVKQPKFNDVNILGYNELWYNPFHRGETEAPIAHCAGPHSLLAKRTSLTELI